VIRKNYNRVSLLPLSVIGIMITALFLFIYATVFVFANPDKTVMKNGITGKSNDGVGFYAGDGTAENGTDSAGEASEKHGTYIILAAGNDEVSGLTDVIMLVAFDTENMKINVVQIPRDTYFHYTDRAYRKINGASSALGGIDKFAEALETSFGINIDYTVQFSLDAFGRMVDLIGGVPVNIPYEMDYEDPYQNLYIHLDAGEHVLDGEDAKQFVRFRSGYVRGDIARTDAQKIFMAAFVNKLTTGVSILKVPSIISVMIDDVKTNMTFAECLGFAQKAMAVKTTDVVMITMPGNDARTDVSGAWYYIINRSAALEVINSYLNTSGIPVTDETFDSGRLFLNKRYPQFEEIYNSDDYSITEYRANDINENGIGINVSDR
jgi:LCP family protein required for cell wall assembly